MPIKPLPRHIVHNSEKEYSAIGMRETRYWTLDYFKLVNKWAIRIRDIDEGKLFNATDLHYIKTCNI